jgi:hypothetical protein
MIIADQNSNFSIRIAQEHDSIRSSYNSYKPDPAWNYTDEAGHVHRWDLALKKVHTLKYVVDRVIPHCCDGDYWETEEGHQECIDCGEHIEPNKIIDVPARQPIHVPLLKHWDGWIKLASIPGEYVSGEPVHLTFGNRHGDVVITGFGTETGANGFKVYFSGVGELHDV